ncbi:MAG: geranylgeranylglyceryl/heptaprenylglyceryl phosphate synthase [Methanomassiliicoccales archaeon]
MRTKEYLVEGMTDGHLHMTLIDPASQDPARAGEIAGKAEELGTNAIMVGGSTGVTQENLDATVVSIKRSVSLPVIYFPSGAHAISRHCDAIYFMSILNSRNVRNVIREQVAGAPVVKKLGLEPISMGYLIVEPGMRVGEVSDAELLNREDVETAVSYSLAAQYLGMDVVYLEAGSGAPQPVSERMVRGVSENVDIPLIVGGGIRRPEQAAALARAGANAVVTGTLIEGDDFGNTLEQIIKALR